MSEQQSSAESVQDFPGLVQDLPLIWQGWCNAIRLMEDKATVRRPENAAQAAAYEQCAKDLKEALTRPARTEPQTASMREALEDCIAFITGQVSGTAQRDGIVKEAERALAAYSQAVSTERLYTLKEATTALEQAIQTLTRPQCEGK